MAEWTWEPDDFAALWFSPANDRFPNPLRFTSRFPYRDDFDAHRVTVRERYSRDELEEIQLALHTLTTSTMRVEIFGGTTQHKNPKGGIRVYRVVGARNDHRAMSLAQATFGDFIGPIRCRLFPVDHLTAQLSSALPPCKPGTQPPDTFHPDDLYGRPNGHLESISRNTPASATNACSIAPPTAADPHSSTPARSTNSPTHCTPCNGTTSATTAATPNSAASTSPSAPPPPPTSPRTSATGSTASPNVSAKPKKTAGSRRDRTPEATGPYPENGSVQHPVNRSLINPNHPTAEGLQLRIKPVGTRQVTSKA